MYITRCAARETFGNQAGHNAQPLDQPSAVTTRALAEDDGRNAIWTGSLALINVDV